MRTLVDIETELVCHTCGRWHASFNNGYGDVIGTICALAEGYDPKDGDDIICMYCGSPDMKLDRKQVYVDYGTEWRSAW